MTQVFPVLCILFSLCINIVNIHIKYTGQHVIHYVSQHKEVYVFILILVGEVWSINVMITIKIGSCSLIQTVFSASLDSDSDSDVVDSVTEKSPDLMTCRSVKVRVRVHILKKE